MTVRPTLSYPLNTNDDITVGDWNTQVVDKARYEQEVLAGSNSDKVAPLALVALPMSNPNLLANGGFERWSNGSSFDGEATPGVMGPDGWRCVGARFVRDTGTFHTQATSVQISSAPASGCTITQTIYNAERFRGLTLTLSGYVRGPGTGTIYLFDGTNYYSSALSTSATQWQQLVASGVIASSCTQIAVVYGTTTAGTVNLDSFMLNATPGPIAYMPRTEAEETQACARYRQLVRASYRYYAPTSAGGIEEQQINFNPPFTATPNYVAYTPGTRVNLNATFAGAIYGLGGNGFRAFYQYLNGGSTGPGDGYAFDDQFTFELP